MEVCGIDPGLEITGYAVIDTAHDHPVILDAGVLRTACGQDLPARLAQLGDDFAEVLDRWNPRVIGVEQLYAHYRHPRTAIQMGHARGVLLATAHRAGAPVRSLAATHIKKYLTGNGRASKVQMQQVIQAMFGLPALPEPPDVADAIAIALCCAGEMAAPPAGIAS